MVDFHFINCYGKSTILMFSFCVSKFKIDKRHNKEGVYGIFIFRHSLQ